MCLSVSLCAYVSLFVLLFVCLPVCLTVCPSVCPSVGQSVSPSVCMSVSACMNYLLYIYIYTRTHTHTSALLLPVINLQDNQSWSGGLREAPRGGSMPDLQPDHQLKGF